jgi:hypothetical protein
MLSKAFIALTSAVPGKSIEYIANTMDALNKHLDEIKVSDIIPAGRFGDEILFLEHNQTISEALKVGLSIVDHGFESLSL